MHHVRLAGAWLASALLVVLGILLFGIRPGGPGFVYIGHGADPEQFIWFLNWWPYAWAHHLDMFRTGFVAAPSGMNLAWRTSIPALGLFAAPFTRMFGALATYDGLMRLAPGLAGFGMFWAAREYAGRTGPAFVAGLVFGFSSYEMAQSLGHLNLNFTVAVPLLVWACLRAVHRDWSPALLAAIIGPLLGFELGVSQEIAATTVVLGALAVWLIHVIEPSARAPLRRLAPGLVAGMILAGLLASPLLFEMVFAGARGATSIASPAAYSTDLLNLLVPTPVTLPFSRLAAPLADRFGGNFGEDAGYLGLPLVILLIGIFFRNRVPGIRLPLILASGAAILSLGPILHVAGHAVFPAPWGLVSWLPVLHDMLPVRFMMYAFLAIGLALAAWLAKPGSPGAVALRHALVLAALAFCLPNPAQLGYWTRVRIPAVFTTRAAGAIVPGSLVLILPWQGNHTAEQYASHMRFRMVAEGYLGGGIVPPFNRWPLTMPLFNNAFAQIDHHEFGAFLAQYGVRDVLLETRALKHPAAARALVEGAGWHLDRRVGHVEIFAPPAKSPSRARLARETASYFRAKADAVLSRRERLNVCAIRRFEARTRLGLGFVWPLYKAWFTLPLPIASISCAREGRP